MHYRILALVPFLMASPAVAQKFDPVVVEPAPAAPVVVAPIAPTYDWNGFYAGAQVNYADADAEFDGFIDNLEGDDFLFGLRAGYDYDFGNLVAGPVVQYDTGSLDLGDLEIENILRIGGRVGFDSGRNLYYATGGYAEADTEEFGDADGFFAGLGYEVFLTDRVTIGAEALYHEFDEDDFDDFSNDADVEAVTVGLNLNFRF